VRFRLLVLGVMVGVAVAAAASVTGAAPARPGAAAAQADVAVLLPDSKSSVRWETQDRRFLAAAFKAAGVSYSIVNAEGDRQKQRSQAEQALTNGAAIQALAKARGAKVIDYDRLTLKGSTAYYVSFNNVSVGRLQGQGIVSCLKANGMYSKKPVVAELHGSPTDNNATLFRQGYESVLNPLYKNNTLTKGPQQAVPDWDNQKALTIFEQMLSRTGNKIDAVAAANDGLANAVISALKARQLKPIPVSGQDATAQGVQNVLSGWQCMTVYKAIKAEADAAAKLAVSLVKGGKAAGVNGKTFDGKRQVPSVLLTPVSITKKNYTLLFKDGFLKRGEVCRGQYAKYCK